MSRLRSVGFGVVLVLLIGAIPTLGWVGLRLIRNSKAGTFVTRVSDPHAAGYEAIVDPTPTALLIQKDAKGKPVALTFLALGGSSGGGSVMFLPLDTAVSHPAELGDRYSTVFRFLGQQALVRAVGTTLNAGMSDVFNMDDRNWAALTAESGPVRFTNPDTVVSGAQTFPAGPVALTADQVGPYLAALNRGESELNRLNRNQLFWEAWLRAIAASTSANVIPGETESGIGYFVRTLSKGPARLEPLPVSPVPNPRSFGSTLFRPLGEEVGKVVAAMVPYPTAPSPGSRISVRLLNGVNGDTIPESVVRRLVLAGATISVVGNDHRLGRATSEFQYRDRAARNGATLLRHALGGRGRLVLNAQGSDAVDLTIVLGADVLPAQGKAAKDPSSPTTRSGATATSQAGGG